MSPITCEDVHINPTPTVARAANSEFVAKSTTSVESLSYVYSVLREMLVISFCSAHHETGPSNTVHKHMSDMSRVARTQLKAKAKHNTTNWRQPRELQVTIDRRLLVNIGSPVKYSRTPMILSMNVKIVALSFEDI